jgi:hypothetical protein
MAGRQGQTVNRYRKAVRIVDIVMLRGVADQAITYSDDEWREMATGAGYDSCSAETASMCRVVLQERLEDPFRGVS